MEQGIRDDLDQYNHMTQEMALSILKTGANVFLTGEPGSGKTYIINAYASYLRKSKIHFAVTASTGIAATHIGGMTIHSWSGIGIKKNLSSADLSRIASNKSIIQRVKKTRILIIDEISMLDGNTLGLVELVCRKIKGLDLSFGGMQIVLVGDFFQLPPVAREEGVVPQFAFESPAWLGAGLTVCYLSEQHRQADLKFLDLLSSIRSGAVAADHQKYLNDRLVDYSLIKNKSITKLFPHNENVDRLNSEELEKLDGQLQTFLMEGRGKDFLMDQLKRSCLSPEILNLKIGALVMFTKNNFEDGFVNGTLGIVIGFNGEDCYPIIKTRDGKKINVLPMEWTIEDGEEVLARIRQLPLRLAWAITIHKSQGLTLDEAFMDLRDVFIEGQGYVALSRVKSLERLYLAGYNDKSLLVHPLVLDQDKLFRQASGKIEAMPIVPGGKMKKKS